jgi:hypothetical protein
MGFIATMLVGLAGSLGDFLLFPKLLGIDDNEMFDLGGLIGAIIGVMLPARPVPRCSTKKSLARPLRCPTVASASLTLSGLAGCVLERCTAAIGLTSHPKPPPSQSERVGTHVVLALGDTWALVEHALRDSRGMPGSAR